MRLSQGDGKVDIGSKEEWKSRLWCRRSLGKGDLIQESSCKSWCGPEVIEELTGPGEIVEVMEKLWSW